MLTLDLSSNLFCVNSKFGKQTISQNQSSSPLAQSRDKIANIFLDIYEEAIRDII